MGKMRVWWEDEFKECSSDEQRDREAWKVPDRVSLFYPDVKTPCDDVEDAAEQYADYFHDNRDGNENTWPLNFVVHNGKEFFLVTVDREFNPTFAAWEPVPYAVRS